VRSVIITGVSRGLGAALFDEFYRGGGRILALGRRFSDAQHRAERVDPQRVRLRPLDLTHPATLPGAAELAAFIHDATEVLLIHNAAVLEPVGAVGGLAADEIATAVAVNLTAPMILTNALLGGIGQRTLTVLFLSSGAARRPVAGWSVYGATKLASESFFEALAAQEPRIRVVTVNPGVMNTDMQARVREYANQGVYFPERQRFLDLHARGELPDAGTVARRVLAEHLGISDLTGR
jgi:benzil reductase ((S)-benzoin forming)